MRGGRQPRPAARCRFHVAVDDVLDELGPDLVLAGRRGVQHGVAHLRGAGGQRCGDVQSARTGGRGITQAVDLGAAGAVRRAGHQGLDLVGPQVGALPEEDGGSARDQGGREAGARAADVLVVDDGLRVGQVHGAARRAQRDQRVAGGDQVGLGHALRRRPATREGRHDVVPARRRRPVIQRTDGQQDRVHAGGGDRAPAAVAVVAARDDHDHAVRPEPVQGDGERVELVGQRAARAHREVDDVHAARAGDLQPAQHRHQVGPAVVVGNPHVQHPGAGGHAGVPALRAAAVASRGPRDERAVAVSVEARAVEGAADVRVLDAARQVDVLVHAGVDDRDGDAGALRRGRAEVEGGAYGLRAPVRGRVAAGGLHRDVRRDEEVRGQHGAGGQPGADTVDQGESVADRAAGLQDGP